MKASKEITFIDLFCGIGGFHRAFTKAGAKCVFANDFDDMAASVYLANYKAGQYLRLGPISTWTDEKNFLVPKHNILVAGFPCQPFSIAGVSKKKSLGREHGFLDKTQGTLFFDIVKILKKIKPDAFLLENVKNLRYHDEGRTYKYIMGSLKELGYIVPEPQIIDARHFVPQHRERIFIVGFHKRHKWEFEFPPINKNRKKNDLLKYLEKKVEKRYTLTPKLWKYLQAYKEKHKAAGNGFGYGLIEPGEDTYTRTISQRYYKDGAEVLIAQEDSPPRRLTPSECRALMGFPKSHRMLNVGGSDLSNSDRRQLLSDTEVYRQFGNSVVVPLATHLAEALVEQLKPLIKVK